MDWIPSALDLQNLISVTMAVAAIDMDFGRAVWKAIGVELVIFMVTVAFAFLLRTATKNLSKGTVSDKKVAGTDVSEKQLLSQKKFRSSHAKADSTVRKPEVSGIDSSASSLVDLPRSSLRPRGSKPSSKNKSPAALMDEITALMRDFPGQRSAARALQLYAEMRPGIGLASQAGWSEKCDDGVMSRLNIVDACRHSQHEVGNFYTLLVQCAVRAGQCHFVECIVRDMVQQGVPRTFAFYESTMKQLAGQKQFSMALNIYDLFCADGLKPSAVTCSCLINFAAEVGDTDRALAFFDKLSSITTPSIRAYMTILRVLSKRRDWTRSLAIFRQMQQQNVLVDHLAFNVLLATGIAAEQLEEVEASLLVVMGLPWGEYSQNISWERWGGWWGVKAGG